MEWLLLSLIRAFWRYLWAVLFLALCVVLLLCLEGRIGLPDVQAIDGVKP